MKKAILFLAVILISQYLFSQNFISENKLWNVKQQLFTWADTEIIKLEGDSTINDTIYKKVWKTNDSAMNEWYQIALIREESNKVYLKVPGWQEGLLYDFNLQEGDTVEVINYFCSEPISALVEEVNIIDVWGVQRKEWVLNIYEHQLQEVWYEGIGSLSGLVYPGVELCVTDPFFSLLCYHENEVLLYRNEFNETCWVTSVGITEEETTPQISIYPNPSEDYIYLVSQNDLKGEYYITDMYGKIILKATTDQGNETKIDVSRLATGTYFIQLPESNVNPVKFVKW